MVSISMSWVVWLRNTMATTNALIAPLTTAKRGMVRLKLPRSLSERIHEGSTDRPVTFTPLQNGRLSVFVRFEKATTQELLDNCAQCIKFWKMKGFSVLARAFALLTVVAFFGCRPAIDPMEDRKENATFAASPVEPVLDAGCPRLKGESCEHGASQHITSAADGNVTRYGQPLDTLPPALRVDLRTILAAPSEYHGKQVQVAGVVERACSRRGCWMELSPAQGEPGCRVTFKDYGFLIPTDSAGKRARLRGTVGVTEVVAEAVAHYESEGAIFPGKRRNGRAQEVRILATGVELMGS